MPAKLDRSTKISIRFPVEPPVATLCSSFSRENGPLFLRKTTTMVSIYFKIYVLTPFFVLNFRPFVKGLLSAGKTCFFVGIRKKWQSKASKHVQLVSAKKMTQLCHLLFYKRGPSLVSKQFVYNTHL